MTPVNKPTRLLSKEVNGTIFSKAVRPNCVSLVTTVATLFFFSGKDFIRQIVGVVCFECDLRSKCHYLRIYNLEDYDLFFDEQVGSNGLKLNSEDPLFFKINFDFATIGLQFQSGPEASMEAKELEKALRVGKMLDDMQPVIEPLTKNLDNKSETVETKSLKDPQKTLDFANDPMLIEIMTLMGLQYNEVAGSPKMQANLRELIQNLGGSEKFLAKLKAKPPDHKAMRAKARAEKQKQGSQVDNPPMQTLKLASTPDEFNPKSRESQSKTGNKSQMPKIEEIQSLEPKSVQKILSSSEAVPSPTISTKILHNRSLELSQTPTKPQENYSPTLIQPARLSPQAVKYPETSPNQQQQINNSPERSSKSSTSEKSLLSPDPHPNANYEGPNLSPQTKTVDPLPTISPLPSTSPPAMDDEIPIPGLKYALPNVKRKIRAVARDGLPEIKHDGITSNVSQPNPVRRNIGWVGKTVKPEQKKDDISIPDVKGAERNVGKPFRNIHNKPEDESTRWTPEKLEKWQQDPVLIEILKLWGLKYEDFCKSEKWQDTLEALIAINGGADNLVKKRLEAISKAEAEEEIPKLKVNKIKIPACFNFVQEKATDSPESESQEEAGPSLPRSKAAEELPAQLSQEQTAYQREQTMRHQNSTSVTPMSPKLAQFKITPVKKQLSHSLDSSQALESQATLATSQQLNYSPQISQTASLGSKAAVQCQMTPVKSLEPIQSSMLPHPALQSSNVPTVKMQQQKHSADSTRQIHESPSLNTPITPVTPKSVKSPLAPQKSPPGKLPSTPNRMLHPVIFTKQSTTPKPSVFTHDDDGSIYFVRTPKNNKEELGKIQPTPNDPIKRCPATPRLQFDDDDDEYQRNANLRDNWQKRIQNRTPGPSPSRPASSPSTPAPSPSTLAPSLSTPTASLNLENKNKMYDIKGSGQKSSENVKK